MIRRFCSRTGCFSGALRAFRTKAGFGISIPIQSYSTCSIRRAAGTLDCVQPAAAFGNAACCEPTALARQGLIAPSPPPWQQAASRKAAAGCTQSKAFGSVSGSPLRAFGSGSPLMGGASHGNIFALNPSLTAVSNGSEPCHGRPCI